jgi:hypothetical protein
VSTIVSRISGHQPISECLATDLPSYFLSIQQILLRRLPSSRPRIFPTCMRRPGDTKTMRMGTFDERTTIAHTTCRSLMATQRQSPSESNGN